MVILFILLTIFCPTPSNCWVSVMKLHGDIYYHDIVEIPGGGGDLLSVRTIETGFFELIRFSSFGDIKDRWSVIQEDSNFEDSYFESITFSDGFESGDFFLRAEYIIRDEAGESSLVSILSRFKNWKEHQWTKIIEIPIADYYNSIETKLFPHDDILYIVITAPGWGSYEVFEVRKSDGYLIRARKIDGCNGGFRRSGSPLDSKLIKGDLHFIFSGYDCRPCVHRFILTDEGIKKHTIYENLIATNLAEDGGMFFHMSFWDIVLGGKVEPCDNFFQKSIRFSVEGEVLWSKEFTHIDKCASDNIIESFPRTNAYRDMGVEICMKGNSEHSSSTTSTFSYTDGSLFGKDFYTYVDNVCREIRKVLLTLDEDNGSIINSRIFNLNKKYKGNGVLFGRSGKDTLIIANVNYPGMYPESYYEGVWDVFNFIGKMDDSSDICFLQPFKVKSYDIPPLDTTVYKIKDSSSYGFTVEELEVEVKSGKAFTKKIDEDDPKMKIEFIDDIQEFCPESLSNWEGFSWMKFFIIVLPLSPLLPAIVIILLLLIMVTRKNTDDIEEEKEHFLINSSSSSPSSEDSSIETSSSNTSSVEESEG